MTVEARERIRYKPIPGSVGKRVRVVMHLGFEGFVVRFTDSCSGCFEAGDYMGNAHYYDYDDKAQCHVGSGCHECGYRGKVRRREWVPFDHEAYSAYWNKRWARRERLIGYFREKRRAAEAWAREAFQ